MPTSRTALLAVEVNVPGGLSVIPAWGPFEIVRSHAALAVAVVAEHRQRDRNDELDPPHGVTLAP